MLKRFSGCSSRGKLMALTGVLVAVPLAVLPFFPEDAKYLPAFALPALQAVFESVSGWTTTGLSVMDDPSTPKIHLFHRSFMQFCGGLGFVMMMLLIAPDKRSTAGGMKLSRVYLMLRLAGMCIQRQLSPTRRVEAPSYTKAQGKIPIDIGLIVETAGFLVCYLGIFITGALLLTLTAGCGLAEGMFEFASSLGTVGLSIGLTGPAAGAGTLIVEICGMILGCLEIFIVLTGIRDALACVCRHPS